MVKLNKIYTRTGDDGTSGLVDGSRASKAGLRMTAIGEVDEANAVIGHGQFASGEDAHDMAFIACMFLEMRLRLAFGLPEGTTPSVANVQVRGSA